ncbi:LysR family transcriptional regulator [Delftia acidovorans]|uniref:LysR family transcriptional regulator n=1 Tax=Delftia acidovorans TaxID=80866 RepID=UPI0022ABB7BD|nr:LysR family transcriptional regulator [Delftia acidovorans]WAT85242.1 LysR family transcriptional regulator [Delftia acidovorans]
MRRLNLDQLQTLVAVADLGTLAAAAQALHLSPPAVSLHIQELEARLDTPLLVRGKRQAQLTPAGALLAEGGRRLLADSESLLRQVRKRAEGFGANVRIGASAGVSPLLLPELLQWLAEHAPGVELRLEVASSAQAMQRLATGHLDLALVGLPQPVPSGLEMRAWRNDPMELFAPPQMPLPDQITPEWLNAQPWIGFAAGTQMHRLLSQWFAQAGLLPQPRMEMSFPEGIRALVAAGHGPTVLPREEPMDAVSRTLQQRGLSPALTRPLGLACRSAAQQDPAVQAVVRGLMRFADPVRQ